MTRIIMTWAFFLLYGDNADSHDFFRNHSLGCWKPQTIF